MAQQEQEHLMIHVSANATRHTQLAGRAYPLQAGCLVGLLQAAEGRNAFGKFIEV